MSSPPRIIGCAEKGCQIAAGGKCVNGIEPPWECPHVQLAETQIAGDQPQNASTSTPVKSETSPISLPKAEKLNLEAAEYLARERGVNVVGLFAPSNAGKTTLVAKLYETFHRGPLGGIRFAGSETVVAFEKRCHGCRMGSGAAFPTTPHTRRAEPDYLHLKLRSDHGLQDFIIVDRNGEDYTEAIGSSERCRDLFEIARCDVLLMLLDGERVLEAGSRLVAINEITRGMRAFRDNELLDHRPQIQILLTKYDVVEVAKNADRLEVDRAFQSLEQSLKAEVNEQLPQIFFDKIAARPVLKPDTKTRKLDQIICRWPFGSTYSRLHTQEFGFVRAKRAFSNFRA